MHWTRHAAGQGAHLVAFPEMVLTGYPVEDLALRSSFVEASRAALRGLARRLAEEGFGEVPVVVGYLDRSERAKPQLSRPAGSPENAAAVLYGGEVVLRFAKHHLPNYRVFDEYRYFVQGDTLPVVRVHGIDVALAICEDLWRDGGRVPAARAAQAGAAPVGERLAVRAEQGRHAPRTGPDAGPGGRVRHRVPGDDRRPGRAGLRRRLDRRRRGERSRRAGPAVRRGQRDPGPGPSAYDPDAPENRSARTGCGSTGWCSPRSRCPRTSRS